jgi:hypothetical protein
LNLLDFSTGSVLRPKGQAMPHANFAALRPFFAAESDRLVAVQIRKHAALSAAAIKPLLRKIK